MGVRYDTCCWWGSGMGAGRGQAWGWARRIAFLIGERPAKARLFSGAHVIVSGRPGNGGGGTVVTQGPLVGGHT